MIKILITFIILYSHQAMSLSCDGLNKDLLAIEHKILNSELTECKDHTDNSYCRPKAIDTSHERGKSLLHVQQDYNEAMAKLILSEGFTTIGKTIEDNHNALGVLKTTDIKKASNYLGYLEDSLDKARILTLGMKVAPSGNSFWKSFDSVNSTKEQLSSYIDKSCKDVKANDYKSLCLALEGLKVTPEKHDKAVTTLHGFLSADIQIQDTAVSQRYEQYQEMLQISTEDETLTPNQYYNKFFKNNETGKDGNILKIKKTLAAYKEKPTKENASLIVDLAKKFDGITVNYSANPFIKSTNSNERRVANFLKSELEGPLTTMSLSDSLLTDGSLTNLTKSNQILSQEYINGEEALENYVQENLNSIDPIGSCGESSAINCLKKLCVPKNGKCSKNTELNLDEFYQRVARLESNGDLYDKLKSAEACYKEKTLPLKRDCLERVKATIPELSQMPLAKLRDDVIKKRKILENYNNASPFKNLQIQKGLVLNQLNSSKCLDEQSRVSFKDFSSSCSIPEVESLSYEAINLAIDGSYAAATINNQLVKQLAQGQISDDSLAAYHKDLKASCLEAPEKMMTKTLCAHYADKERRKQEREAAIRRLSERPNIQIASKEDPEKEGPGTLEVIGINLLQGLTRNAPQLMSAYSNMKATQDWEDYQIQQISAYDRAYQANFAMEQERINFMRSMAPDYRSITGYGDAYIYNSYTDSSSFQSYSSTNIYSNPISSTQYNFNLSTNSYSIPYTNPTSVGSAPTYNTPYTFQI